MRILIPGNLLLLGEYAVILPQGLGIAVAVEPYVTIDITPSHQCAITSFFQGEMYIWKNGQPVPDSLKLVFLVLQGVRDYLGSSTEWNFRIRIDSSAFCYSDGKKKGFGSSAAVVGGLTYALLKSILRREPHIEREVFPLAYKIHCIFQGGKGSGYDVMASLMGGSGLFTGQSMPTWKGLDLSWQRDLYLIRGDEEASSTGSIQQFQSFCTKQPGLAEKFYRLSNNLVQKISDLKETHEVLAFFRCASFLNRWLALQLGIPSEGTTLHSILSHYRRKGCSGKALGAGGEIAALLSSQKNPNLNLMHIAPEGIQCLS